MYHHGAVDSALGGTWKKQGYNNEKKRASERGRVDSETGQFVTVGFGGRVETGSDYL